jgi:hypothetical protein
MLFEDFSGIRSNLPGNTPAFAIGQRYSKRIGQVKNAC